MFASLLLPAARRIGAPPSYTSHPVAYGSGDYLSLNSTLSAGYKNFVLALILRKTDLETGAGWVLGHTHFHVRADYEWNVVRAVGLDSDGNTVFDAQTYDTTGRVPDATWCCVLMSRTGTDVQVYVGDNECANIITNTDTAIAFDWEDMRIGLSTSDIEQYDGDLALVALALDQTLDLSVEANRRKFFDASGIPVDPRDSGLTWTILVDQAAASLANAGTGPALTVHGTPTDSSNTPVDVL